MPHFASQSGRAVARRVVVTAAMLVATAGSTAHATQSPVHPQPVNPYGLDALLDGSGFVPIPPGECLMGASMGVASEGPVHRVRITKGFQMGKFEVTQAQWDAVMRSAHQTPQQGVAKGQAPTYSNPSYFKGATLPVDTVSWGEVHRFLATLNGRDPNYVYRLPTEAEWECASSAGSIEEFPESLDKLAWSKATPKARRNQWAERAQCMGPL